MYWYLDPQWQWLRTLFPYLVGVVVGMGGFAVASYLFARRARRMANGGNTVDPNAMDWEKPTNGVADRRSSIRREGSNVAVYITSTAYGGQMRSGWVMDRSTGGLRIAVKSPLSPGSTIQVRAENAPDSTPWVTLHVRSCKDTDNYCELGCSFDQTPPWNVLLLFG